MNNPKIFLTGHSGLIGNSLYETFIKRQYSNIIVSDIDLRNKCEVDNFF